MNCVLVKNGNTYNLPIQIYATEDQASLADIVPTPPLRCQEHTRLTELQEPSLVI